ncbi:hypothetical protein JVU11DRAFT_9443 [Chiua virens]|nr:hypothetical protein JVU11DRAFT_9443 [Chiua virens]
MAAQPLRPQHLLPRLNIPPSLNMQQPGQPIFSPGLPTSIQQSYLPPPFQIAPIPLHTPMQPFFSPQPQNTPARPTYQHHKGHSSIAHFPSFPPPTVIPITPLGQGFPVVPPPFGQPFIPRNRRAPSMSIGGPPKAPLGGPGRKHSPLPPPPPPALPAPKGKKLLVNLPVETIPPTSCQPPSRPPWARTPMPTTSCENPVVIPPEISTADPHPPDTWRHHIPDTVDVFLPGKVAWDAIRQQVIEEKLVKLGVERGAGGSISLHAPHARAASISSPADPSLLYFKLNKLQQSQNASAANSLTNSPQQTFDLSPSPGSQVPPRLQNRHGHSLSLAHPPPISSFYNPAAAFNPFGPSAVLGSDSIEQDVERHIPSPMNGIHAPQGRVPMSIPSLAPPSISRGSSRPDFNRGFGLDIPEEEEPQEEPLGDTHVEQRSPNNEDDSSGAPSPQTTEPDGITTVAHSTHHSRHVSRLSHALSLYSVGGIHDVAMPDQVDMVPIRSPVGNPTIDDLGSGRLLVNGRDPKTREALANGPILRTRNERVRNECSVACFARGAKNWRHRDVYPTSLLLLIISLACGSAVISIWFPIQVKMGCMRSREPRSLVWIPWTSPSDLRQRRLRDVDLSRLSHTQEIILRSSVRMTQPQHTRALAPTKQLLKQHIILHPPPTVTLNPHAKPFVFGSSRGSSSPWGSFDGVPPPPALTLGHARLSSFGKPLNAAAQEFKPTGFTFRPPPGVPQLTFPVSPTSRPLPVPPATKPSPPRSQQGREKRRRRGSHTSASDDEGDDSGKENMATFRFPPVEKTHRSIRHTAPNSPYVLGSQDLHTSGGPLQPLTFSGFPSDSMRRIEGSDGIELEEEMLAESEQPKDEEPLPAVAVTKPKRAPIPLDFKNPPSTNTVPAGVFKALVGDEKTRRTVRSRLSSHEFFEHSQRPSLDDLAVPPISMSANRSRSRFVTDPGVQRDSVDSPDIFTPAIKRRSSLPAMHSAHNSSLSNVSIPAINLTKRLEAQALEDKIEAVLEEKFQMLRSEIAKSRGAASISPTTEDAVSELVSLFRTQLQESAARALDDTKSLRKPLALQTELREAISRFEQAHPAASPSQNMELAPIIDQINHCNLQVILNTIGQLSNKIDTRPFADQYEKDSFIEEILAALGPHLKALHPEAVDYDALTARLSQAVKPNIEQLIDLAADKRETAGLIVESLIPLLPSPSAMDMDPVIAQISSEVRRVIAPIDAHEIKEQVADLVVERLDARLANRDKAFNPRASSEVYKSITDVAPKLGVVANSQAVSIRQDRRSHIQAMPTWQPWLALNSRKLKRAIETTRAIPAESSQSTNSETYEAVLSTLRLLQTTVETVANAQSSTLTQRNDDDVALQKSFHQVLVDRLDALPESLNAALIALQNAHAEFMVSQDAAKCDADEIRKLRAASNELQVNLAKARGAHGQVRVEKDNLAERLKDVENDRDRLRGRVDEMQADIRTHASEVSAVALRNSELEDALSQSLARLKTSDVAAQSNQERIAELEKANKDATSEQQALMAQLGNLQMQVQMAEKEKELTAQSLRLLQQDHESLVAQQSHWEDLHRVAQQIEAITSLRSQTDEDELRELRRMRDQHRQLESEISTLQKRARDQELRATNSERTTTAAKQNLIGAQQRASEWERRAREYESDLERTRNKLQLEEKEAEDRLVKDRESKFRDQISSLEAQLARLEVELSVAKVQTHPTLPSMSTYGKPTPTKNTSPPRPDSRASTVFDGDRSRTPIGRVNGSQIARSDTPPQTSVWDSMHAPKQQRYSNLAPAASYARRAAPTPSYRPQSATSTYRTQSVASPTPSTVSLTPTVDDDGWWS